MKYFFLVVLLFCAVESGFCQQFSSAINKDSLFQKVIKDLPNEKKEELQKAYNDGSDAAKGFLLLMLSMPSSSKQQLINNIDSNFEKIVFLKTEYAKLIPKGYYVNIEFNAKDEILLMDESIDLIIEKKGSPKKNFNQAWNLTYDSDSLKSMIKLLGWTNETLKKSKSL